MNSGRRSGIFREVPDELRGGFARQDPETKLDIIKAWIYRPIGRIALILAVVAGIYGRSGYAAACLAVALWVIWSLEDDSMRIGFAELEKLLKGHGAPERSTASGNTAG